MLKNSISSYFRRWPHFRGWQSDTHHREKRKLQSGIDQYPNQSNYELPLAHLFCLKPTHPPHDFLRPQEVSINTAEQLNYIMSIYLSGACGWTNWGNASRVVVAACKSQYWHIEGAVEWHTRRFRGQEGSRDPAVTRSHRLENCIYLVWLCFDFVCLSLTLAENKTKPNTKAQQYSDFCLHSLSPPKINSRRFEVFPTATRRIVETFLFVKLRISGSRRTFHLISAFGDRSLISERYEIAYI